MRNAVLGMTLLVTVLVTLLAAAAAAQEPAYGTAAAEIAEKIAQAFPKVEGRVIGLERERILIDLGQKDQVIPGLELQVFREGQEFKHPFTGQVLGKLDRDVGRVRIVEVRPNFSLAEIILQSEGTMVQQGDRVRVTSARVILALPNVDASDVSGANTRAVTRDLTNALVKTGRFEVMTDQRIRGALAESKVPAPDQFADPATLQALWKRLRVSAVLLGKLSLMEQGVQWDVQVLSTVRGDSVTLASVEVKGAVPRVAAAPARPAGSILVEQGSRLDKVSARSDDLGYQGLALAVGDLTGDGGTKLAVTDGQTVFVYTLDRAAIREVARIPGTNQDNIVALDAADINGNGVAELFVTNFTPELGLRSYILEYRDQKFQRTWSDVALSFRVLPDGKGAPRLYAQSGGKYEAFSGPVRHYTWQGGSYVPGEAVPLPRQFNQPYGFLLADLENDGGAEVVLLDHMDYLRIYNQQGGELYRSGEHYGGSEVAVEYLPAGASGSSSLANTSAARTRVVLQGRLYYQDLWGDGKRQLILPRNTPSTGYVFQTRMYDKGKLFGFTWDGVGLLPAWETREFPGRVADYALVDGEEAGQKRLVALVVRSGTLGLVKGNQSQLLVLDLQAKP